MSFKLNMDEINKLNNMISLGSVKLSDARFTIELRNKIIEQFQYQLIADCKGLDLSDKECKGKIKSIIKSPDKDDLEARFLRTFSKGFSTAILMGFLQSFKSDRKIDGDSPEFGYTGLDETLTAIRNIEMSEFADVTKTASLIQSGLLVNLREVSVEEYFEKGIYHNDIDLLTNISLANIDDGYNIDMLDAIAKKDDIKLEINTFMTDLTSIYNYVFEDGFGIHPYAGVLVNENEFAIIDDSNKGVILKKSKGIMRNFANRISSKLNGSISFSNSRQFDYDEIYSSNTIVFFPYKILEYSCGRESSLNLNKYIYLPNANSSSWDAYFKDYVYENLKSILIRGYYKAIELVLMKSNKIDGSFTSDSFCSDVDDYLDYLDDIYFGDLAQSVKTYISKLVNSMKCIFILTQFDYLAGTIASLGLRLTDSNSTNCFLGTVKDTTDLFKNLVGDNENEEFFSPFNLSEGRLSSDGKNLSVSIYDFKYDINPLLAKAEPLFGYVIQKQNQRKNVRATWGNILIGESISRKELYSKSGGDICLQDHFIHNIYAGSRSGKGVMTMNILASAIAAGKPIFYLDRKPDMASMLYRLSGGNMFVVNGGLINPSYDIYHDFDEHTGSAMSYWRETVKYLETHDAIRNLISPDLQYNGRYGDLIYLRAFMFCFGLTLLRGKLKGSNLEDERTEYLNGDGGIVVIVDELTSAQEILKGLWGTGESPFFKAAKAVPETSKIMEERKTIDNEIEVLNIEIQEASGSKNKASKTKKLQNKIEELQRKKEKMVNEDSLYAKTFFDKMRETYEDFVGAKNACFKNFEYKYSDIFVLGQQLGQNYFDSGSIDPVTFFPRLASKEDYKAEYKNADFIRTFLELMGEQDWFIGRNEAIYSNYGDKSYNAQARKFIDDEGNWEYIKDKLSAKAIIQAPKDIHSVLFKSYLVLNGKDEENPENIKYIEKDDGTKEAVPSDPIFQYTCQCRERTNENAGGSDLWADVRVKHLTEDAKAVYSESNPCYNCLEDGIGFKGLVRETLKTTGADIDDEGIQRILSKSEKAANYVAVKMGFDNWQDLIFDLSPNGLFSPRDMVKAVMQPQDYSIESRLPLYSQLGALDNLNETTSTPSEPAYSNTSEDLDVFEDLMVEQDTDNYKGSDTSSNNYDRGQPFDESEDTYDNDWYYDEDEDGNSSNSSNLPFTKEELAEALVKELAPNFTGVLKQKAIETVLELFKERGIEL